MAHKVSISRPGSWDQLSLVRFELTSPVETEVTVKIYAAGVNFADIAVRLGLYESAKKLVGWPITPGFDIAGVVVAVGDQVSHEQLKIGDRVFGVSFFQGYSTHVNVPANQLFRLPEEWSFERGAAFPTVHLTAWYALHQQGQAQLGQRALIHSAAGGVGLALIQLCRRAGLQTVGVVRGPHKCEIVSRFGADHVIDKSQVDLWREVDQVSPEGFDLIFDANGYETLKKGYERLRPEGRLICFGAATMLKRGGGRIPWFRLAWRYLRRPTFDPLAMTADNKSILAFNLSFLFHRADLLQRAFEELLTHSEPLSSSPITCFPLSDVVQAHQLIESGTSVGKIVLLPHSETKVKE